MTASGKPVPEPDPISQEFWQGVSQGELRVQQCRPCGHRQLYGRPQCTACGSMDLVWRPVSGRGTIYSFTVIRRTSAAGWRDDVPYVVALIQLDEGPRMMSNVVGCDPADVQVGGPVVAAFTPRDDVVLPLFRLCR